MKLIGIDGGGTKTEAVLFDETGRVLGRHRTGPCNPNLLGLEESAALVKECVDGLMADGGRPDGIYLVGTGAPRGELEGNFILVVVIVVVAA